MANFKPTAIKKIADDAFAIPIPPTTVQTKQSAYLENHISYAPQPDTERKIVCLGRSNNRGKIESLHDPRWFDHIKQRKCATCSHLNGGYLP